MFASRMAVMVLLAIPLCLITSVFGHRYGLVGAAAVVLAGAVLSCVLPVRWRGGPAIVLSALMGIGITATLHVISRNTLIIDNASGQRISRVLVWSAGYGRYLELRDLPEGSSVARVRWHDLFFTGTQVIDGGELADGTKLERADNTMSGHYSGIVKATVLRDGVVTISWP